MGCANSKPKGCQHCHCNTSCYSSVPRSFSVHLHHPPQCKVDSYHVVALTSTTLGSLDQVPHNNHDNGLRFPSGKIIDSDSFRPLNDDDEEEEKEEEEKKGKEESEAKTWYEMIEQLLPKTIVKTPISTPPCEPETINTWELMEGLEDTSPFISPKHLKSFYFDVNVKGHVDDSPKSCGFIENGNDSAKSIWPQNSEEEGSNGCSSLEAAASYFDDPQVVVNSSSNESLQEKQESMARKGFTIEEEKIISDDDDDVMVALKATPFTKDKVVLYFTSLRGVRKTYEDSCHVRLILKGLGVRVDERDVSMHSGFKEELKELLGHGYGKGGLGLPRVFIGRNYIGGAEDIRQLHEDGKLEKLLDCCEKIEDSVDDEGICEACRDIRFVPCETCYGSCKIYYEGYDEDDGEVGEYGFKRCPDCNENGLIRCPICCY